MSSVKNHVKTQMFNLAKKIDKLKDSEIIYEIQNNLLNSQIQPTSNLFDIKSTKDIISKEPTFLIDKILPIQENEVNIISSKGGVGKTSLALYLLLNIKNIHNKKVFGFFSEDSLGIIKDRLEKIIKANNSLLDIDINILGRETRPSSFLTLDEDKNLIPSKYFLQLKQALKKYDVVVVDPLLAFLMTNENSNIEARAFMNLLNEWAEQEQKTFILLHHHNKENQIRGATDFVNAARIHYVLKKENNKIICALEKENHLPYFKSAEIDIFSKKETDLTLFDNYNVFEEEKIEVVEESPVFSNEVNTFFNEVDEDEKW